MKCREHELNEGRKASAADVSQWLSDFLSLHPDSDDSLSLGILVAGWDNSSGPSLYKVNGKGELLKSLWLGTGSASAGTGSFICKDIDRSSKVQATELVKRALFLAAFDAPESCKFVSECQNRHFREAGLSLEDQERLKEVRDYERPSKRSWAIVGRPGAPKRSPRL
ncbi:OLC1v1005959C1 [Oldenlandia corymbosa var. corymbosa]|uniref:OLC1v1005959C1 n=1 Tax=Oldenlandia corymbosa var. corymbosa TaxID=529605 RepID=A0AAV1DI71_OLDCO|nr:OLC1v1005959C1 [Oldenlandia corymbosa var. corymbosa]